MIAVCALVLLGVLVFFLASSGGDNQPAAKPTATVDCEFITQHPTADLTFTFMKAPVTITTPVALDSAEVQIEAHDTGSGAVLPRGTMTVRFEDLSPGSPHTYEAKFNATAGWPDDTTCTAEVLNYVEHSV